MCILFVRKLERDQSPCKLYSIIRFTFDLICSVIAFNRDEDTGRRTEPLHKWTLSDDAGSIEIYSGIDKEKSGTWLALSEDGRFCCVTNNREAPFELHPENSRGNQVIEFFKHAANESFTQHLMDLSKCLSNSNFVYGSLATGNLDFCQVKGGKCRSGPLDLEQSFVLANGSIDSEWPKQQRGRKLFDQIISESRPIDELAESLFGLLHDRTECSTRLPCTVLDKDAERKASAIFIDPFDVKTPSGETIRLATRSSSVIITTHDGHCWVSEETPGCGMISFELDFI